MILQLGSHTNGRWVLGIEGTDDEAKAVLKRLAAVGLLERGTASVVLLEAEKNVPDHESTLRVGYDADRERDDFGCGIADLYRLEALTPPDDPNRRAMLRTRNELFCATADVVIVCGVPPERAVDPGHFTVRMALARVKPVVWVEALGDGSHRWRYSGIARVQGQPLPAGRAEIETFESYSSLVEDLLHLRDTDTIERWRRDLRRLFSAEDVPGLLADDVLKQWWNERVLPVLMANHIPSPPSHDRTGKEQEHAHAPDPGATVKRIASLVSERVSLTRWGARTAGGWYLLFTHLVLAFPFIRAKTLTELWNRALRRWFRALGKGESLNAPVRNFVYKGIGGLALKDSDVIDRVFDGADERALVDAGRYRSAIWLGYLLSIVAVLMAALNVVHHDKQEPPIAQQATSFGWAISLTLLIAIAQWRTRLLRRGSARKAPGEQSESSILRLCFVVFVVSAAGVVLLPAVGALRVGVAIEIAALAAIVALVCVVRVLNVHERWLVARALAEAVRHDRTLFPGMALSRLSFQSAFQIDSKGLQLADGFAWWLARMRADEPLPRIAETRKCKISLADRSYMLSYVRHLNSLVTAQMKYHKDRADQQRRFDHRMHTLVASMFVPALLCVIAHALRFGHDTAWESILTYLTIAFPVTAAGFHAINAQLESGRHAVASEKMAHALQPTLLQLEALRKEFDKAAPASAMVPWSQVTQARRLATTAADAMLTDVEDWFRLVAAQPMNVPA